MSYHLCIKLCTCLGVHRIKVEKSIANTLCYAISREKRFLTYNAQRRYAKERDKHVFVCDDILIKVLQLDEESRESKVFW